MFILAREGQTYARLQFNVGPRAAQELLVEVDFTHPFAAADHAAWSEEYLANVTELAPQCQPWREDPIMLPAVDVPPSWREAWHAYSDEEFFWQEVDAHECR
jgi:hypothetical protein